MSQRYAIYDYETRSECDLRACGSYEYSVHPSTQILCVAWRLGTREMLRDAPTRVWSPFATSDDPRELIAALSDENVILVAHNALFENVITNNVLRRSFSKIPLIAPSRFLCTAALASVLALPRKLEGACKALGLSAEKNMTGHKLMMKYSKPRKATKNNTAKWHNKTSELRGVMAYCADDIAAETELFLTLPSLTPTERKVWELDQNINLRGFTVDRPLVSSVLKMIGEEITNLDNETATITSGEVRSATQVKELKNWINNQGAIYLENMQAKTIVDTLAAELSCTSSKRLLEIRQAVSKTSTAKYEAFESRSRFDSRLRDNLMYHGASTGRWTGLGVQPQNFPRPKLKNTNLAAEILREGNLEQVRMFYGDPMEAFSNCLRSVITPAENHNLYVADYAAIEVRVLFWLAGHTAGLQAFIEKRDLYKEMAMDIYRIRGLEDVTLPQRQLGKGAILGAGFGMGPDRFVVQCAAQGIFIDENMSKVAIKAYRTTHSPVVKLWYGYEAAARQAILNPGKGFSVGRTRWFKEGRFLYCTLPSGRKLAYCDPVVKVEMTKWGEPKQALFHWGVNGTTKQWELQKTWGGTLCENVTQASARDLMAAAMLRIDAADYKIILSVHDELISERKGGSLSEYIDLMTVIPDWAKGCPVSAEGWSGKRYGKN